jgi:hypothetical protein
MLAKDGMDVNPRNKAVAAHLATASAFLRALLDQGSMIMFTVAL